MTAKIHAKELDTTIMAVYNFTSRHVTSRHVTSRHVTLLPEYRVTFIRSEVGNSLEWLVKAMHIRDKELISRFVRDDDNPDYIIASDKCLCVREDCLRLKDYLRRRQDSIFIFFTHECVEPDMNVFDYAFTWNPDLICGDRIGHNVSYICGGPDVSPRTNDFTHEDARRKLESNLGFCNFIYSHSSEPRDSLFRLLSQYKRVDSSGAHLNNTGTTSTRWSDDWYKLSIEMKEGYKFSIAMENSSSPGYTTEKLISSLLAHTVPIYWGDPRVTDYINPAAFINCNDYGSMEEVIERVKEIDNDDEQWIDMVTQPWQTEEQRTKTELALDENDAFIRNIFAQDIKKARRRGIGMWPDRCQMGFTGVVGILPPFHMRIASKIRNKLSRLMPAGIKSALKKLLGRN